MVTTISEHYINMGRKEGWDKGLEEGRKAIALNMHGPFRLQQNFYPDCPSYDCQC